MNSAAQPARANLICSSQVLAIGHTLIFGIENKMLGVGDVRDAGPPNQQTNCKGERHHEPKPCVARHRIPTAWRPKMKMHPAINGDRPRGLVWYRRRATEDPLKGQTVFVDRLDEARSIA
jgi:hypothetical protein